MKVGGPVMGAPDVVVAVSEAPTSPDGVVQAVVDTSHFIWRSSAFGSGRSSPMPPSPLLNLPTSQTTIVSLNDTVVAHAFEQDSNEDGLLDNVKLYLEGKASIIQEQAVSDGIAAAMRAPSSPCALQVVEYAAGRASLVAIGLLGKLTHANDEHVRNVACKTLLAMSDDDATDATSALETLNVQVEKAQGDKRQSLAQGLLAANTPRGRSMVEGLLAGKDKAYASAVACGLAGQAKDGATWPVVLDMAQAAGPHRVRLVETLQHVLHSDVRDALLERPVEGGDADVLKALFALNFETHHCLRDPNFAKHLVPHLDTQPAAVAKALAERIVKAQSGKFAGEHFRQSKALCAALISSSHVDAVIEAEDFTPPTAAVACQFLNATRKTNAFEGKLLLREKQMRRWIDIVVTPENLEEMKQLDLQPLMFVSDYLQAKLTQNFPQTMAQIDAKGFDETNAEHMAVAYLRAVALPHAYKYLGTNKYFNFESWERITKRKETHDSLAQLHAADKETKYLAYEAHVYMKRVVEPLRARARALGVPLMLVANVTYGGTIMSILPLRKLEREGVKIVFTKMSSSLAHGSPDCMEEKLFTPEQMRFILQRQPIIAVADGSASRHYPDGLRGYHNFGLLLNEVLGVQASDIPHQPGVSISAFPKHEMQSVREALVDLRKEVSAEPRQHTIAPEVAGLWARMKGQNTAARGRGRGYGIFYHATNGVSLKTEFGDKPAWLDLNSITGPSIVHDFTSMSSVFMMRQRYKGEGASWKTYWSAGGKVHRRAYYDDRDEQSPSAFMGGRGLKFKPVAIQRAARAHFKSLQDG